MDLRGKQIGESPEGGRGKGEGGGGRGKGEGGRGKGEGVRVHAFLENFAI